MQKLIKQVRKDLIGRLEKDKAYYSIEDLYSADIPPFIIKRIELELIKNLADSIVPPKTDWANMDSEIVRDKWEQFVSAIQNEVRLPQAFVKSVFDIAVEDSLDLLIQPRKCSIDQIFAGSKELNSDEIIQNLEYLTVYPYLKSSLTKYIQKKNIQSIDQQKAQSIISIVDDKITSNYTPLNWAQLVSPLFDLFGDNVDSELFRLFFEDKNRDRWAKFFDQETEFVNKQRFIEILSQPIFDGIEVEPIVEQESEPLPVSKVDEEIKASIHQDINFTSTNDTTDNDDEFQKGSVRDWGLDETIDLDEEISTEESIDFKTQVEDDSSDEISDPDDEPIFKKLEPENEPSFADQISNQADDIPFWQRFVQHDGEQKSDTDEGTVNQLIDTFKDMQDEFVSEIFGNEYNAYILAIEEISKCSDWGDASEYVKKEIFQLNKIQMHDEIPLEFIERLQSHFLNKL